VVHEQEHDASNNQLVTLGFATRYTARVCQAKNQPITVIIDKIHVHGDCDTYFYDLSKTRIDEVVQCFKDDGCNVTVYYQVDFGN